jgi:hypothetical protein
MAPLGISIQSLRTVSDALEKEEPVIVHCLGCRRAHQVDPFHIARLMGPLPFGVVIGKMRCRRCKEKLSVVLPWYTPTLKEWAAQYRVPYEKKEPQPESTLFRLDVWKDKSGGEDRTLGWLDDLDAGKAALNALAEKWPDRHITIRRGALVMGEHGRKPREPATTQKTAT